MVKNLIGPSFIYLLSFSFHNLLQIYIVLVFLDI